MTPSLNPHEQDMLDGLEGEAPALAMRILVGLARSACSSSLVGVTRSHVAADLSGGSTLDWLRTSTRLRAEFKIPTTLNIASFDLLHPEMNNGGAWQSGAAREVMFLAAGLGGAKTWTCAPYLLADRPSFGEHVAWSESGVVVFANSVLGARTDRSGTFTDMRRSRGECYIPVCTLIKTGSHKEDFVYTALPRSS